MPVDERDEPLEDLGQHLRARPEILEAYVFGSRARGEAHAQSDIDVAVYIDPDRLPDFPFGYAAELTTALATALHSNVVDVVVLNLVQDAPCRLPPPVGRRRGGHARLSAEPVPDGAPSETGGCLDDQAHDSANSRPATIVEIQNRGLHRACRINKHLFSRNGGPPGRVRGCVLRADRVDSRWVVSGAHGRRSSRQTWPSPVSWRWSCATGGHNA